MARSRADGRFSFRGKVSDLARKECEEQRRWENDHFRWTLGDRGGRIECRLVEVEPVDYPEDEAELLRWQLKRKIERHFASEGAQVIWLPTVMVGNARH